MATQPSHSYTLAYCWPIHHSQITCLLKFRYNQYMGNARKQLFFGIARFPSITCPICPSLASDNMENLTTITPLPKILAFTSYPYNTSPIILLLYLPIICKYTTINPHTHLFPS
jgi:hypothetical protein